MSILGFQKHVIERPVRLCDAQPNAIPNCWEFLEYLDDVWMFFEVFFAPSHRQLDFKLFIGKSVSHVVCWQDNTPFHNKKGDRIGRPRS